MKLCLPYQTLVSSVLKKLYKTPKTKRKGNRVFSHLEDVKDSKKVNFLQDLKLQNLKPKIEILVHGLEDEKTALRVEHYFKQGNSNPIMYLNVPN